MQRWDIFCRVIDNYGDAGVCWRLARQLAKEHGIQVRLWIDNLPSLAHLVPNLLMDATVQTIFPNLHVHAWGEDFSHTLPGQVVIETFACDLPLAYLQAMAAQSPPPVWINLEYLSAEDWVTRCHLLPSPHPSLALTRYFFFPGLHTGGFLREANLYQRWTSWLKQKDSDHFLAQYIQEKGRDDLKISLFSYENPALPSLLQAWADHPQQVHCFAPMSSTLKNACLFFGVPALHVGQILTRGSLRFYVIPFVPQEHYDTLLWDCDLNFVRGEDSFVRAQFAGKPMVWHIYQQTSQAHLPKLNAFLQHYHRDLSALEQQAVQKFYLRWNQGEHCSEAWMNYAAELTTLKNHAQQWAEKLYAQPDLTRQLYSFVQERQRTI